MKTINQSGVTEKLKPGIPSIETRLLADFIGASTAEVITYEQLSAHLGQSVQGKARGYLLAARAIVMREKGQVFRPIKNLGIKRLTQSEVARLDDRPRHILQTAKRQRAELRTVDVTELKPDDRASFAGKSALNALDIHTHSPKQIKRLEAAAAVIPMQQIDFAATLALFGGDKEKSA